MGVGARHAKYLHTQKSGYDENLAIKFFPWLSYVQNFFLAFLKMMAPGNALVMSPANPCAIKLRSYQFVHSNAERKILNFPEITRIF